MKRTNGIRATPAGSEMNARMSGSMPSEEDRRLAVALEPAVGPLDLARPICSQCAVPFEQLEAPAAADAVGDPRADQRAEQPREDDPDHRQVMVARSGRGFATAKPANSITTSEGIGMHAALGDHQHEDRQAARRRGRSAQAIVDERFGDRREDEHAGATIPCASRMRVWIDLTNSPHVLVMRPVIERLHADGHDVRVTARDFAQTIELCERFGIAHTAIGHHRGERLLAKAGGLASRSAALVRWARADVRANDRGRFDIALGHGSNDVSVAAAILRVPSATTFDYEWATVQHNVNCRLARAVVVPDAIPPERLDRYGAKGKVRSYEGLKEEYYLADFEPDAQVLETLAAWIASARSSWCARRRRCRSTTASRTTCSPRCSTACARPPRRTACSPSCCRAWTPSGRSSRACPGFVVPEHAIDAQSLIAHADLVISAGGTMNREAVALGVPVYTTFEGRLGAVDERLIAEGRLRKLAGVEELELPQARARGALQSESAAIRGRSSSSCSRRSFADGHPPNLA